MKNSAKLYLTLAIAAWALFVLVPAQAQSPHHEKHNGMDIEKLKSDLDLSEEQVAEINELKTKFKSEMNSGSKAETRDREGRNEVREAHKKAFETILTPDQLSRLKELKVERKENMEKQRADMEQWKKNEKPAMIAEIKTYTEENVIPVLKEKRLELDDEIESADKVRVAELRTIFRKFQNERKSMKGSVSKEERKPGSGREAFQQKMEAVKPYMEEAKALATKYDKQITGIMEDLSENRSTWESDMKVIHKKYAPKFGNNEEGQLKRKEGAHHGNLGEKRNHGKNSVKAERGDKEKVKFLLMDPNGNTKAMKDELSKQKTELNVYPNPSRQSTTVEYEVLEPGKIVVELHNSQGTLIRSLINDFKEPGKYKHEIDLSNLGESVYFIVMTDVHGVKSRKLIKTN